MQNCTVFPLIPVVEERIIVLAAIRQPMQSCKATRQSLFDLWKDDELVHHKQPLSLLSVM
jgi:hypothetical protein